MPGYDVGEAFIRITPNFQGFIARLDQQMRQAGDLAAREFARAFQDRVRRDTDHLPIGPSSSSAARSGAGTGTKFAESFKRTIEATLRSLPEVRIDANATPAQRAINQLRAELTLLGARKIGIDLSANEAVAELERLRAELDEVQRGSTDIDIKVETARAKAEIDRLRAEVQRVNEEDVSPDVHVDTTKARGEVRLLGLAIATLGPAALTAGAVVGGALAGLIPIAGSAAVAVLGVRDAWKSGALEGTQFETTVSGLRAEFFELKAAAAAAFLPGLTSGAEGLRAALGPLRNQVTDLSAQMGRVAGVTGPALGRLFVDLEPLGRLIGNIMETTANRFAAFTQGNGLQSFSNYVAANLPRVLDTLGELASIFGKLAAAAAPFGQIVLAVLGTVSSAIDAIPREVLSGLVTLLLSAYAAFKIFGLGVAIVRGVGAAIDFLTAKLTLLTARIGFTRAVMVASLGAFGLLAAAVGVFAFAMSSSSSSADDASASMQRYADSVKKSTDVLAAANIDATLKGLKDEGGLAAFDQVNEGVIKVATSYRALATTINKGGEDYDRLVSKLRFVAEAHTDQSDAARKLLGTVESLHSGITQQIADQQSYTAALTANQSQIDQVAKTQGISADRAKDYAGALGLVADESGIVNTSTANLTSTIATVQSAFATASQTGSEFLDALKSFSSASTDGFATAADRANLIGATLKAGAGDAINYIGVINSAANASANLGKQVAQAAKQAGVGTSEYLRSIVNLRTGTINYRKAAAGPLITALQSVQKTAIEAAKATYQHTVATKGGRTAANLAYNTYVQYTRGALVSQAKALGINEVQARRLAKAYLDTPARVKTLVQQEGASPIVSILRQIRDLLGTLTGHPFTATVGVDTSLAMSKLRDLQNALNNVAGGRTFGVSVDNLKRNSAAGSRSWTPDGKLPAGYSTVG